MTTTVFDFNTTRCYVRIILLDGEYTASSDDFGAFLDKAPLCKAIVVGHPSFRAKDIVVDEFGEVSLDFRQFYISKDVFAMLLSCALGRRPVPTELKDELQIAAEKIGLFDVFRQQFETLRAQEEKLRRHQITSPLEDVDNVYDWVIVGPLVYFAPPCDRNLIENGFTRIASEKFFPDMDHMKLTYRRPKPASASAI